MAQLGGKALTKGTRVITPFGERNWEDLTIGSSLVDYFGKPTKIIAMTPWLTQDIYAVTFNDGTIVETSAEHLWTYWITSMHKKKHNKLKAKGITFPLSHCRVASTLELKARLDELNATTQVDSEGYVRKHNIKIPIAYPTQFTKAYRVNVRPIAPYVLGVLLGDGVLTENLCISDKEEGDTVEILKYFMEDACDTFKVAKDGSLITSGEKKKTMLSDLKTVGLFNTYSDTKYIPDYYKYASIEDRFKLIQGLMDTDGHAGGDSDNGGEYSSASEQLANDVAWVLRSLGAYASVTYKPINYYRDAEGDKVFCKPSWRVYWSAIDQEQFFRLERKKKNCNRFTRDPQYFGKVIESIEYVGQKEARCVTVDNVYGLFLANDFTVTHNSYSMRAISITLALECPGVNIYLFRKTYTELDSNHMLGPNGYRAMLATAVEDKIVRIDSQKNIIQFKNGPTGSYAGGSIIYLRHVQYEKDVHIYQGAEIHVLMIDEATHFSEPIYTFLRARVRLGSWNPPEKWKNWFPRIICSSNPGSAYHNLWKHMFVDFVDKANPYMPKRASGEEGGMLRQYIPATIYDNPALLNQDPTYIDRLKGLGSPELVRAMLEGDWDIVAGGMFDDVWKKTVHVVEPFEIPRGWYLNRGFDWGSSKPFAVLWYAESNGEPVWLPDDTSITYPPGTLFVIDEWYGNNKRAKDPNTGIFMANNDIGRGIRLREENNKVLEPVNDRICVGPADNSIYTIMNNDSQAAGINAGYWDSPGRSKTDIFFAADKSHGSRVKRWSLIRDRLSSALDIELDKPMERPGLFIFNVCNDLIRTIPTAPRADNNNEDIDSNSEDHLLDALGYRVLQSRAGIGRLKTKIG